MNRKQTIFLTALTSAIVAGVIAAVLLWPGEKEAAVLQFEAEQGVMNGVEAASETAGYAGGGYVTGFDQPDDSVEIPVEAPEAGLYDLRIGYHSTGGKYTWLYLNGEPFADVQLHQTEGFQEVYGGKVLLQKGANTIGFKTHWGWYDIDYVSIQKVKPRPEHQVERKLVNPNATPETVALHEFLIDHYGKYILSGQQTLIDSLTLLNKYGKEPAVTGFDLIDYSPSRVEHGGSDLSEVGDMLMWHNRGGITTLAWHWTAPTDLLNTPEQPWYRGFYTDATTFDLEAALADKNGEHYQLLLRDIDAIAVPLQQLQSQGVPVLWRPLHEAEGGWFWWGAKGPEPAKELYRILYDRLTNHHGLNNLIWVWNSEAPEWYPGDDVVDIISIDSYPQPGDYSPLSRRYENLVELVQGKKLVALTENGPIPDPDLLKAYEAHWSWFVTWTGEFINDGIQNSEDHIRHVLEHEYVLTLDELKTLRSSP